MNDTNTGLRVKISTEWYTSQQTKQQIGSNIPKISVFKNVIRIIPNGING